jgi:hypothetical protein
MHCKLRPLHPRLTSMKAPRSTVSVCSGLPVRMRAMSTGWSQLASGPCTSWYTRMKEAMIMCGAPATEVSKRVSEPGP